MRNKKYIYVVLMFLTFALAFSSFLAFNRDEEAQGDNENIRAQLTQEFSNSFEEEIEPDGVVVEYDLVASKTPVQLVDGTQTDVWAYNGQIPGPVLRVKKGDTIRVNFTNNLLDETTIHWHGVRVPNAMDGVPGVTQDPIQPGETFVYEFTPKDAGTFWYHPHVRGSEQVERGLYGALIVEDDYQEYSRDLLWVLDDWRLMQDAQIYPYFDTAHDVMHDGRWGNYITVNAQSGYIESVQPGERIRLRLINTSNARIYRLDFGDFETAKAIATDGMLVAKPFNPNGYELSPGNRLDVDIIIPADATEEVFTLYDTFLRGKKNPLASFQASGEKVETPSFDYPTNKNIPTWDEARNFPVDKEYILDIRRSRSSGSMSMMAGGLEWTINGKAFPDYDPIELQHGVFNKLRWTNASSRLHPMHLHGQFFKVLSRNGKSVDEGRWLDTVLLHPNETIEIGLVPLDKGEWANHCHILEHAEAGMMTIVNVK